MFNFIYFLAAKSNGNWGFTVFIYIIIIVAFIWWMGHRRKQVSQRQEKMRSGLVKGAHVVTIGGLHGIVDSVDRKKKIVTIDVEGVFLPFEQRAIARILDQRSFDNKNNSEENNSKTAKETKDKK